MSARVHGWLQPAWARARVFAALVGALVILCESEVYARVYVCVVWLVVLWSNKSHLKNHPEAQISRLVRATAATDATWQVSADKCAAQVYVKVRPARTRIQTQIEVSPLQPGAKTIGSVQTQNVHVANHSK